MPVSTFRAIAGRRAVTGRQRVTTNGGGGAESPGGGGGGGVSTNTVNVSSIAALKTAAADNSVDVIVLADGTYSIANATSELTTSLFFGSAFASRTRALIIQAQTTGGVTFDGGSASMCGLYVGQGAHDITFDGFKFANIRPVSTGVVTISQHGTVEAPVYNLTFKNITILGTCLGTVTTTLPGEFLDHGFYLSSAAKPGPHDITIQDCTVIAPADNTRYLHSVLTIYGDENAVETTPYNVTVTRLTGTGKDGFLIWGANIHDCTFTSCTFTSCRVFGARQQYANLNMRYISCTSTGSGTQGFYNGNTATPDSAAPTGTTFTSCSWG